MQKKRISIIILCVLLGTAITSINAKNCKYKKFVDAYAKLFGENPPNIWHTSHNEDCISCSTCYSECKSECESNCDSGTSCYG